MRGLGHSVDGGKERKTLIPRRPSMPRIKQLFSLKLQSNSLLPSHSHPPVRLLPTVVIVEIGRHLTTLRDILSLSLVCRRARTALIPNLYTVIELKTNRHIKLTLASLERHPEIAVHVKELTLRPNNADRVASNDPLDEKIVSSLVLRLANNLTSLEAFCWDGSEFPEDDLWFGLKDRCPLLKSISTSLGIQSLQNSSRLFDFSDLRRFSLVVKCMSMKWLSERRPTIEKLPKRLWEMLLQRCPNLEELALGGPGPSPRIFEIKHITFGRWPRLHTLIIGDAVIQTKAKDEQSYVQDTEALARFFDAHSSLRNVAFRHPGGGNGLPFSLSSLSPSALPNMISFAGPPRYIQTLPHLATLQHLTITSLHHSTSSFPPTYAILQSLPSLISLNLWIDLSFAHRSSSLDDRSIFRTLLECCPRLLRLEVACFTRPSFHVREFSAVLRFAPRLESFSLTKLYKPNDEDMSQTAIRIIHDNPNIRLFTLQYSQDSWLVHSGGRARQIGNYEVLTDGDGLPRCLLGQEWGVKAFGQTYTRRYSQTLASSRTRTDSRASRTSRSSWYSERAQSPCSISSRHSRYSLNL